MIPSSLGLHKDTQLISLGMVTETDQQFYCEFGGINTEVQDDWIKENVLANTIMYGNRPESDIIDDTVRYCKGSKEEIRQSLEKWLSQFEDIELVSDVCHYDMVLFIDIFGTAFDLPTNVSACCHDINSDIARYCHLSEGEAFNVSREKLLENFDIQISGEKHNSLYDAIVIKNIYENVEDILI